jgi:GntR family transcriptional regulator, transcriptional repressor for pyruvate dehydrogenase complex
MHAIATSIASENADEARRLAEEHIMGQLGRLTQVNFELSTQDLRI